MGLTFNFGALMGWAAIDGRVSLSALLLYIAGILWTLGYDTIYAYQDKEDDELIGVKSTALLFGDKGRSWVFGFYAASLIAFVLAGVFSSAGLLYFVVCIGAYLYYFSQLRHWRISDTQMCLKLFKQNMFLGFLLAFSCAAI